MAAAIVPRFLRRVYYTRKNLHHRDELYLHILLLYFIIIIIQNWVMIINGEKTDWLVLGNIISLLYYYNNTTNRQPET